MQRFEIMTGRERRRRWSLEEKLAIVAETWEPGVSVAEVARRHDLHANQIYGWRRLVGEGRLVAGCDEGPPPATFAPVAMVAEPCPGEATSATSSGVIEVTLVNGHRVRIEGAVDGDVLARVIGALAGA